MGIRPPHAVHVFPTFSAGGAETRTARTINALGGEFRHTVVSLSGERGAESWLDGRSECNVVDGPGRSASLWRMRSFIKALAPDLLITYNWGAMDVVAAWAWGAPWPRIHNECGVGVDEASGPLPRRALARGVLLNGVDRVVVVSRDQAGRFGRENFVRRGKLRFIQTGVDADRFSPGDGRRAREAWGVLRGEVVVGYAGGLRTEKNVALLVEAFVASGRTDARLVLVGDGGERGRLEEMARSRGVAARVVFAGRMEDTAEAYRAFDVFALSSKTEATPNALLEAMASGLPCVATDVGDCRYLVGAGGMVTAEGDAAGMAESLRTLVADPALRGRMGAMNRERALNEFRFDRMVAEYGALYREVLGR